MMVSLEMRDNLGHGEEAILEETEGIMIAMVMDLTEDKECGEEM
jgi:hypothetical protein